VDADDGVIDGNGATGRSMIGSPLLISGNVFVSDIRFYFDEETLGYLPTHVGLVCTDGFDQLRFEAYGRNAEWLGTLTLNGFGDGVFDGGTAEDRFFGVIDLRGISEIRLTEANLGSGSGGAPQIDHLQYGTLVPEPPGFLLALCGAGLGITMARLLRSRLNACSLHRKWRFQCFLGFLVNDVVV
jgi:hypothetical protein